VSARGLSPFAIAAAAGVLYFLGYLGFGVWPCLFVFLVPLWSVLEDARGPGTSVVVGFVFGLTAYVGGFGWLLHLVDAFLAGNRLLGGVLWLAYGTWFAAGFALYAAVFHRMRARGWPLGLAAVPPLIALEWLQPQIFPVYAGGALVSVPALVQTADLGGPLLLTALVAGANLVGLATWRWWRGKGARPLAWWTGGALVALLVIGYGWTRMRTLASAIEASPALRVGVVQANLGLMEKRMQALVSHQRHLDATRRLLADGPLDLVVWPETAYVGGLRRPLPVSGRPIRDDLTVPLLFGSNSIDEQDGQRRKSNSAFLVDADGTIHDGYDKNLLIPLAEYVPLGGVVPALVEWFPHVQEFRAAHHTPPLHLGAWRIATPICYEVVRPEFVRRMVRTADPHLLVTLANDAWFGDSQEPWLHLALARLRAVEHRRFLVRSTNSGVSAVVDPMGRIVARTRLLAADTLRATVHPLDGRTVYTRLGDWPGWLASALVVVGVVLGAPGRRRCEPSTARDAASVMVSAWIASPPPAR
jgi:apolipoprotein N-acyltransferase